MRTIQTNELTLVAGGCPVCPLAPGVCAAAATVTVAAGAMGYEYAAMFLGVFTLGVLGFTVYKDYPEIFSYGHLHHHDHHH